MHFVLGYFISNCSCETKSKTKVEWGSLQYSCRKDKAFSIFTFCSNEISINLFFKYWYDSPLWNALNVTSDIVKIVWYCTHVGVGYRHFIFLKWGLDIIACRYVQMGQVNYFDECN